MTSDANLSKKLQQETENFFGIGPLEPRLKVSKEDAGRLQIPDFISNNAFGLRGPNTPAGFIMRKAEEIQENENAPHAARLAAGGVNTILNAPNELVDAAKGGFNYLTGAVPDSVKEAGAVGLATLAGGTSADVQQVQNAQRQTGQEQLHLQQQNILDEQAQNEAFFHALGNGVQQATGGSRPARSGPIDLGAAPSGGGQPAPVQFPAPPPAQDFSEVQAMIERTRPENLDEERFEKQRKNAMIIGALGAISNGQADSVGEGLAMAASGMFVGAAQADQAKQEAQQQFKQEMNDYWLRIANVKRSESESEDQYARRVWQNQVRQLQTDYRHEMKEWENNQPVIRNTGNGLLMTYNKDGRIFMDKIDVGKTKRNAKLYKSLVPILGEEKAKSVSATLAQGRMTRTNMVDLMTNFMIGNGKISEFYTATPEIREIVSRSNSAASGFQVKDDAMQKEIAENHRITKIQEMMMDQPALFNLGMELSGIKELGR